MLIFDMPYQAETRFFYFKQSFTAALKQTECAGQWNQICCCLVCGRTWQYNWFITANKVTSLPLIYWF